MSQFLILFLGLLSFQSITYGFSFSDTWNQTSYGQFINSEEKAVSVNFGYGLYQNKLQVSSQYNLETTNNNFYILSARLNKAHVILNLPGKSSNEERLKNGNSKFNAYSLSYDLSGNLSTQLNIFKIEGFYYLDQNSNKTYKLSNLENRQINLNAHYTFNEKHKSFYTDPMIYEKGEDTGSWIIVGGLKSSQMNQINELVSIPELSIFSNYSSIQLYAGEISGGYSKNWFWNHFFVGGAYGLGLSVNAVSTEFKNNEKTKKTILGNSFFISMTTGYIWQKSKLAIYANMSNSSVKIDEIPMGSTGGSTGLYYGYSF